MRGVGRRLAPAERIERFADRIDAKLRADEQSETSMRVFTDSSVRRILKDCGYERRGARNLERIQQALVARAVYPDPPLTTPGLDWEHRIHFTRTPPSSEPDVQRVRFPAERDVEAFLEANFDLLFKGMRLERRQHPVQRGRVDMLARDRDGYVVIELKRGRPGDEVVHQLADYMDDVAEWLERKGRRESVRGIVVAGSADDDMYADLLALGSARGRRIDWLVYDIDFVLHPATSPSRSNVVGGAP